MAEIFSSPFMSRSWRAEHPEEGRAALWHGIWAAALVGSAALMTVVLGGLPGAVYAAFGAMAAAGLVGLLLRGHGRIVLVLWAAAATLAVSAAGGVTGPGAAWLLTLFPAAAVLGRSFREAAVLSLAALLLAGLAELSAVAPLAPGGLVKALTVMAALATTAWAFVSSGWAGAEASSELEAEQDLVAALVAEELAEESLHEGGAESDELAELRRRLDDAEAARAEAVSANAAKSRFLANMSHELRTPLNAIMGFADIMRNKLFGPLPDRYSEYAQLIHESGSHLLDLINDVLDMSKIEAEKFNLSREVFDAREAIAGVLKLMRPQADDAGVDLRGVLPEGPLQVNADKRALKQIALNLMSNALKFTPKGGSVTTTLSAVEGALELTVADTGVGIAAEDIARLGRPFEQAGEMESRARGTGLGLSLVRAFAGLHGGEMAIESTLGEGTAVTVRLPVLADAAGEDAPSAKVIPFAQR